MLHISYINGEYYLMNKTDNLGFVGYESIHTLGELEKEIIERAKKAGYCWQSPTEDEFPTEYFGFKKIVLDFENGPIKFRTIAYENENCTIKYETMARGTFHCEVTVTENTKLKRTEGFNRIEEAKKYFLEMVKKYSIKSLI